MQTTIKNFGAIALGVALLASYMPVQLAGEG